MRRAEIRASTDAVVRMLKTGGDGAFGHHGVGIVEQVGSQIRQFAVGDSVLVACIGACGHCAFCLKFMYSHCTTGGWILAEPKDTTTHSRAVNERSELVRIPHADTSLTHLASAESPGRAAALLAHRSRLKRILDAADTNFAIFS
ncbi:MAG: alcohol dehydrogenase catalytic domain-containing protein [Pseudomonadota bacterium]|nr:alcohol dehydrogenase catalytic domain-containing protein [Pseudomonadota bacterium]